MTIQEQLNEIKTEKENIKTVLINKGIHLTGISFTEYHNILKDYNFQIPIETTLTSTVNNTSIHYGATVTISGTISATDSTILSGQTVTLYNDTTSVGTATIDSTGAYSLTYTVQTMTSPNLTVKYAGKGLYTASTSEVPVLTISKADTVITLSANPTTVSSGGSTTLTVTLKDEWGNNLNGETVKILNGTTELYSGIIVSNSYTTTYSPTSNGIITLTSKYSETNKYNTSNIATINISYGYLFNDTSSSTGLNNYNSYINLEGTTGATMSYNSNGYYELTKTNGGGSDYYPIKALSGVTDCTIECDIMTSSGGSTRAGISTSNSSRNGIIIMCSNLSGTGNCIDQFVNGSWTNLKTNSNTLTSNTWYHLKVVITNGKTFTETLYTSGGSQIFTQTATTTAYTINNIGLNIGYNNGYKTYYKNIKAYNN